MPDAAHLNLDDAWPMETLGLRLHDARLRGPALRYHATAAGIDAFSRDVVPQLPPFVLYGSGDFHHLSSTLVLSALQRTTESVTLVSFDNHPDWDIRPPNQSCGGWINRALEHPRVELASIWGCGNFELAFPARLFANRAALRSGRLKVHAWAERQNAATQRRFNCMNRENWRTRFIAFAERIGNRSVYITVDMDCLCAEDAATNWENGLFTAEDVAWAITELRGKAKVIGGDVCGAWSEPIYERCFQRFAGNWDHPKLPDRDQDEMRRTNLASLARIWPCLAGA